MRIKVAVVALITVLVSLVVGHSLIRAQTLTQSQTVDDLSTMVQAVETTTPIPALSLPFDGRVGTFYSAQFPSWPPLPGNINQLPAWNLGSDMYLVDDQSFDYNPPVITRQTATSKSGGVGMMTMDASSPPAPGGGFGTNSGGGFTSNSNLSPVNTNLLWLQITNVSGGTAYANLHNATDQVYAVWSTTDLTVPFSLWPVETEVFTSIGTTNILPFTVSTVGRQNLFLRAEDWTGVYANGLPSWWMWEYFHTLNLSWTNVDANNNTLGSDYTNRTDPDIIAFTIGVTNTDVNTAYPNLPLDITVGVAGFVAILINDSNLADAVWQPFAGTNVMAILGTDGEYNVSVGLRGFPTNATATWDTIVLTKNTVVPVLTITNLVSGSTVYQTPIQFQGLVSEPLDTLTYDLTNAYGALTNQIAYLTGPVSYTNGVPSVTNGFQSDAVNLAVGANAITLHATDWAGNQTNVTFTVNYSLNTNPPVLTPVWPQAGASILGTNITLQAHVSDPTATVSAMVNGNTMPGLVDTFGSVWMQNVPLNQGSNAVTLTASTALGGTATTTFAFTVVTNDMQFTVDPITTESLNSSWISLSGTINVLSDAVYVNGVAAQVRENDRWVSDWAPVSPYGMATLNILVSNATQSVTESISLAQPTVVTLMSVSGHQHFADLSGDVYDDQINWFYQNGGTWSDNFGDQGIFSEGVDYVGIPLGDEGFVGLSSPWEDASISVNVPEQDAYPYESHTTTRIMIAPGGASAAGTAATYLVLATACEFSDANITNSSNGYGVGYTDFTVDGGVNNNINPGIPYRGDIGLPPQWLQIGGKILLDTGMTNSQVGETNYPSINSSWGATIVSVPAGEFKDITPVATRVYKNSDYTFNAQAYPLTLNIIDANTETNLTLATNNTVIVGQQMNLTCQLCITNSYITNFVLTNFQWTVPGFAISNYTVASDSSSAMVVTNFPTNNEDVAFFWVDGSSNRIVQCSATVDGKIVTGQATFNVIRPTVDFTGAIGGAVAVDTNYAYGTNGVWLHFGGSVHNGVTNNGIVCTSTNVNVFGYDQISSYSFVAAQTIYQHYTEETYNNGTSNVVNSSGLDNIFPTSFMGEGNGNVFVDAPGEVPSANVISITKTDSFRTVLMFWPAENSPIYIPIKEVDWSWSGQAVTNGSGGWTLIQSNATISINNLGTTGFSLWTNVLHNIP